MPRTASAAPATQEACRGREAVGADPAIVSVIGLRDASVSVLLTVSGAVSRKRQRRAELRVQQRVHVFGLVVERKRLDRHMRFVSLIH